MARQREGRGLGDPGRRAAAPRGTCLRGRGDCPEKEHRDFRSLFLSFALPLSRALSDPRGIRWLAGGPKAAGRARQAVHRRQRHFVRRIFALHSPLTPTLSETRRRVLSKWTMYLERSVSAASMQNGASWPHCPSLRLRFCPARRLPTSQRKSVPEVRAPRRPRLPRLIDFRLSEDPRRPGHCAYY